MTVEGKTPPCCSGDSGAVLHKGYLKLSSVEIDFDHLEQKKGFFALATGEGGVGS